MTGVLGHSRIGTLSERDSMYSSEQEDEIGVDAPATEFPRLRVSSSCLSTPLIPMTNTYS